MEYGKAATAPANPSRDGYTFTGWDKDFSNITSDLTVTAQFILNPVVTLRSATTSAKDFISIAETSKNSNTWVLTFKVTETYSDNSTKVVTHAIQIKANNANVDGRYNLGKYTLMYDIKGNGSNIKEFRVVMN